MTTIAACAAGPDDLSPGARRVDAANQRDAWLRQMELARMAGMGGTPIHAAAAPAQPARAPGAAFVPSAAQVAARPAQGAQHDDADTGTVPDGAPAAAAQQTDDGRSAARPAHDATGAGVPAAAMPAPPAPPAPLDVAPAADTIGAGVGAVAAPGAAFLATTGSVQAGALAGAAVRPSAAAVATSVIAVIAPPQASRPAAPSAQAPAPREGPEPGDAPDWQKRIMHLTGDGDDVRLWIRDGDLSPAQTQQLVARLAGDVAAVGLRLREATVNGKPALRTPAGAEPEPEEFAAPITHPTTER